ncbi:8230_t:CDS:1, partial [Gigaspora rosea]
NIDNDGYFYINNYWIFDDSIQYGFIFWSAPPDQANIENQLPVWPLMTPDLTNEPWV